MRTFNLFIEIKKSILTKGKDKGKDKDKNKDNSSKT